MKIYHFDLGNSTKGPIGFCADVRAKSKAEAVKILQSYIESLEDGLEADECSPDEIKYCNVYFNAGAISEADIDDEREDDSEEDSEDDSDRRHGAYGPY